jgi:hypothetical protein
MVYVSSDSWEFAMPMFNNVSRQRHSSRRESVARGRSAAMVAGLLPALQSSFESQRDQFDHAALTLPEWRSAEEAVERAQRAWNANASSEEVETLCREAQRRVQLAVERSFASRIDGESVGELAFVSH